MCRKMIPCFFAAKSYTHFGQQDTSMELRLVHTLAKADDPKADNDDISTPNSVMVDTDHITPNPTMVDSYFNINLQCVEE